jgi:hypothetical protein
VWIFRTTTFLGINSGFIKAFAVIRGLCAHVCHLVRLDIYCLRCPRYMTKQHTWESVRGNSGKTVHFIGEDRRKAGKSNSRRICSESSGRRAEFLKDSRGLLLANQGIFGMITYDSQSKNCFWKSEKAR